MVSTCCICKVESGQQEAVSFHKILKNEELKRQWFLAVGHEMGKHSVVCSLHFTSDDFYKIYKGRRRRLLPTAVPSEARPSVKQTIQTFECNSAAPKDFTASEEWQKKKGESLNVIPTTNRLFNDTDAPLIESANVPSCVQNIFEPTQSQSKHARGNEANLQRVPNMLQYLGTLEILDQMILRQMQAG